MKRVSTSSETIGCDLGDKKSEVCVLSKDGKLDRPKPVPTTRAGMLKFFDRAPAHVVIEVGTHSRWVSELLSSLGHRVTIANPRRVQLISQNDSKQDRTDAELLARLGRADTKLLAPIQHRGEQAQADLAVAKARDALVRCRTKLINQARGLVKAFGFRLPSSTSPSFHRRARAHVPESLEPALAPTFAALESIEEQIKIFDKTLEQMAERYPEVQALTQPSGVGLLTALVFMLTLDDKERFKNSRSVGAFIGLRPKRDQSGDVDKQLHITKAGDPFLRRLLVQAAHYTLGPFGTDSDLRRWGLSLAKRGGKNAKKRAVVAVARKLAVLLHRLWVTGEEYEPIGYAVRSEAA